MNFCEKCLKIKTNNKICSKCDENKKKIYKERKIQYEKSEKGKLAKHKTYILHTKKNNYNIKNLNEKIEFLEKELQKLKELQKIISDT